MAPGCFTLEQPQQQQQKVNDFNDDSLNFNNNNMNSNTTSYDMLILNEISYDLDNIFSNTSSTTTTTTTKYATNTIPLPTSPYPYEDNNDEQQQQNSSVPSSNAKLCDTVDSFEILEQTIMKQKRLGRSKHVDLRKKVLLKRTFDLVCEIMDHENGFEEEEGDEEVDEQSKNLLNVNTPQESLDLVVDSNSTNTNETLPNLVNLVYLDTNAESTLSTCTSQQQVATDGEQNDKLLRTILNEQTQFNANTNSSLAQLTTMSSSPSLSQKRKHSSSSSLSSPSSNKKIKLQSQPQQQRRPSNSDDDDEEEEEEDEDEYSENEENFICLFDDDNDPFGIADVVNLTSFKTTTTTN